MPDLTQPETLLALAEREALAKAALEAWRALPEDERSGERPYIMGFNAGWEEAVNQAVQIAQAEPGAYPHGNQMYGSAVGPKIAAALRALASESPR